MPRRARSSADNQVFHVLNRGNCRMDIFGKRGDFAAFIKILEEGRQRTGMRILAYCLMSNHWHLVLWPRRAEDLSRFMQWISTTHAFGGGGSTDNLRFAVGRLVRGIGLHAGCLQLWLGMSWLAIGKIAGNSADLPSCCAVVIYDTPYEVNFHSSGRFHAGLEANRRKQMATKTKMRSPGSDGVRQSMAELQGYIDKGMTIDEIVSHYRKHRPDRIRTVTRVSVGEAGSHTAASIKKMRLNLEISQAVFAQGLGVSTILVSGWEQGVREPSLLARRLLDIVSRDPAGWLASLAPVQATSKSRRAG
jgi:DNA-binding transcriptional regulator YiaG/REP element-mobilizing transposase RayT